MCPTLPSADVSHFQSYDEKKREKRGWEGMNGGKKVDLDKLDMVNQTEDISICLGTVENLDLNAIHEWNKK